jgi:hypothetical protein
MKVKIYHAEETSNRKIRRAGRREKEVEGTRGSSKKWICLRQCDENSLTGK